MPSIRPMLTGRNPSIFLSRVLRRKASWSVASGRATEAVFLIQDPSSRAAAAFTARYPDRMHRIYRMPFSPPPPPPPTATATHRHRHPSPSPNPSCPSCHPVLFFPHGQDAQDLQDALQPPPPPSPIAFSQPILSILPKTWRQKFTVLRAPPLRFQPCRVRPESPSPCLPASGPRPHGLRR